MSIVSINIAARERVKTMREAAAILSRRWLRNSKRK